MYCRNCGSEVDSISESCAKCGFLPLNGTAYCQECGFITKENQLICTSCQERLKFAPSPTLQSTNFEKRDRYDSLEYYNDGMGEPNTGANVAACCSTPFTGGLPIVGLVLYLVWKDEKPNAAKSVCIWSLIPSIGLVILYLLFFIIGGISTLFSY